MPRASLLILGFVLRFAHIIGHGVGEDKCVGSACPKAGNAMLQHKSLSQQDEGLATAREDPVTYEEVGTDMRCHPKLRRLNTWFDLNGGRGAPMLSREECQAKCTDIPDCHYFSMMVKGNTTKGKCTSFTGCDRTQTGVKKHTTWKKVEPPKPTCQAHIGDFRNELKFFHYYCSQVYAPKHCGSYCVDDPPNPDSYYYWLYYYGYCAQEYCPQCGHCEMFPTPAPPACWTSSDLVQFAPGRPGGDLNKDVRRMGIRNKCGRQQFRNSYSNTQCQGWGKDEIVFKGDDFEFRGNFEYEDFMPCKSA